MSVPCTERHVIFLQMLIECGRRIQPSARTGPLIPRGGLLFWIQISGWLDGWPRKLKGKKMCGEKTA